MVIKQRKQIRLKNFDYSDAGWYFVTVCTQNREYLFGDIINNKMSLNQFGKIVNKFWNKIPNHFNNVELNDFQIMPNHIHGIIVIQNIKQFVGAKFISPETFDNSMGDLKIAPTANTSLSNIIKWFKSISTINIRKLLHNFRWQKSFYDHIVRNEYDLYRIRKYITNNPINWDNDRNNLSDQQPNRN